MIAGKFGEEDELFFQIDLIAADGLALPVEGWLDTGFSGWLAMNSQDVADLNWPYIQLQTMQTAQGKTDFEIYIGTVRMGEEALNIPVHAGDRITEFLLGRQWLKTRRLVVDMPLDILTLGPNIL